jgi:hypothetical protein
MTGMKNTAGKFMLGCMLALTAVAADYKGPRPEKPDVPYLLHADRLVELEVGTASEEKRKDGAAYAMNGASSPARTPMAEPIFIMESKSISPERMGLYKFDVKNGRRELVMSNRRKGGSGKPYRMAVTRLGNNLYRIEASETLENGEYSLSPEGSNQVYCFEVY